MRLVIAAIGILGLILLLKWQFPYAVSGEQDNMRILYLVALLALVGSGVLHVRRHELPGMAKAAIVWVGIIFLLVLGYSFRDQVMGELVPQRVQVSEDGSLLIRSGENGHFNIEARVNGVPVLFMVDTGASDVVLSPRDAERAGFTPETLNFSRVYQTANGTVKGAPVKIKLLQMGDFEVRDVKASVNGADMEQSLLGMSFLKLFKGYRVEGNTLTLVP